MRRKDLVAVHRWKIQTGQEFRFLNLVDVECVVARVYAKRPQQSGTINFGYEGQSDIKNSGPFLVTIYKINADFFGYKVYRI